MTVKKQLAQDGGALDSCMDQLVEVLTQLLDEPVGAANPGKAHLFRTCIQPTTEAPMVVVQNPKK